MKITCLILGVLGLVLVVSIMADTTSSNNPPVAVDDTYCIKQGETLTTSPQGGLPLSRIKTIQSFAEGIDIGDIDNDGTKELVVTKPLSREVEVYDPLYNLKYTISFGDTPRAIVISDLDNDGKNELVVATSGGAITCGDMTWSCLIGYGADSPGPVHVGEVAENGDFSIEWTSPPYYFRFATQLAAGDFNSNGTNELVMGLTWYDRKLVSYEYDGTTYTKIFEDPIGSDTNCVYASGDQLLVGTSCWSDYGLRVYEQYNLVFSDVGDGMSSVGAGDVDGDGIVEIVRGVGTQCGGNPSPRPRFWVYNETYTKVFTSPEVSQNNDCHVHLAVGDLVPGGGQEIAVGTASWTKTTPERIRLFQYNGASYIEKWQEDIQPMEADTYYLKIADLNGDGLNELFVSTTYGLLIYTPSAPGVLANDSNVDGDTLTAMLVNDVSHGTLILDPDGSFTYTPDADFFGTDSFTYRAYDGLDNSNIAAVNITVNPANSAPTAVDDAYQVKKNETLTTSLPGEPLLSRIKTIESFVEGVEIGDVDNDGAAELVVTKPLSKEVEVYDSLYNLKYTISLGDTPRAIVISDLDNDGKNELAAATSGGSITCGDMTLSCLIGYGADTPGPVHVGEVAENGDFSIQWTSPSYSFRFATQLAAGDFNSNGTNELVMGLSWWDRKLISYEYDGTTYTKIFEDPIGSDTNCVYASDDQLLVGTSCWSDYGLRVYEQYNLVFSDVGDGISSVGAGDVDGDGIVEIARGVGTQCGGNPSPRPRLWVYNETYTKVFTSPELTGNNDCHVNLAVGDLIPGGGQEIAVGTASWVKTTPKRIRLFQYNGSTYIEKWQDDLQPMDADAYHLKIADLDGDGLNELYVSTTYGLLIYTPSVPGVLANDSDLDGDTLTAILDSDVSHGTLLLNPDGSFTYTPGAGFIGTDSFTYKANDGKMDSSIATVTINVVDTPSNSAPTADAGDDQWVITGSLVSLDGSASSDPDGDPLTYQWSLDSLPEGSTAVLPDPTAVNPTFTADVMGDYVISLVVDDGTLSSQDTVIISVVNTPASDQPVIVTDEPTGTTITFSAVTSAGITTVMTSSDNPVGSLDENFKVRGVFMDISTTAVYTGSIDVCFDYSNLGVINLNNLKLLHWQLVDETNYGWVNVTTNLDEPNHIICGSVDSLSWFVLVEFMPNHLPIANAGENITISSEAVPTTIIQGTAADEDPDDLLEYRWKEGETVLKNWSPVDENSECPLDLNSISIGLGAHNLTLEVTDGQDTSSDNMILTIENSAPHPGPTGSGVYEVNTDVILGGYISDYDGDLLTYKWLEGSNIIFSSSIQAIAGGTPVKLTDYVITNLDIGIHTIVLQLDDGINEPVSAEITVEIVDSTVPTLAPVADKTILWPPNHNMADITIESNAADNSGLPPTITAAVTSNEPTEGLGDGDTSPDWTEPIVDQNSGIITLQLRAERSGTGNGRVYTITVTATDNSNNSSTANIEIIVPHDKKKN